MNNHTLQLRAVPGIPHIQPGDVLGDILLTALQAAGIKLVDNDILAIAQKIISKAEGRYRRLADVVPSSEAQALAQEVDKDPRQVQLILDESVRVSRKRKGVLIVQHRLGFTCANAGIDRSNVDQMTNDDDRVLLLPENPDQSAAKLHQTIASATGARVGIVITDSHGRPFRLGATGIAIGVAGIPALLDRRGATDLYGYELKVTEIGLGDEIAAAAGLLMGQANEGIPVVHMRGLTWPETPGQASDLVRPAEYDLYS